MHAKFKWVVIDKLLVSVASTGDLADDTWKALLNDIKTNQIRFYLQAVVGTLGMTSAQRALGIDVVKQRNVRIGVLTDDSIVRGLCTAASWFNVDVHAYPWKDTKGALTFLGVQPERMDSVLRTVTLLKTSVME